MKFGTTVIIARARAQEASCRRGDDGARIRERGTVVVTRHWSGEKKK